MAKLYFRYGAMGSSKSANALMVRYNYLERGKNVLLMKPSTDTRDGVHRILSRCGLEAECTLVEHQGAGGDLRLHLRHVRRARDLLRPED